MLTIFAKSVVVDVLLGSKYAFGSSFLTQKKFTVKQIFERFGDAVLFLLLTLILNNVFSTKPINLQLSVPYFESFFKMTFSSKHFTNFLSLPPIWSHNVILKVEYVWLRRLRIGLSHYFKKKTVGFRQRKI